MDRTQRGAEEGRLNWTVWPGDAFSSVRAEWGAVAGMNPEVPFLHTDFIALLLEVFGSRRERIVVGTQGGSPVAAAVLTPARLGAWQTFQPSQLPLGALVCLPGRPISGLAASMLKALPWHVLRLGMTQIDPRMFVRPDLDALSHTLDYIETAWIDVGGDFESYWAARGRNLKQNMAKQRRKLEADGLRGSLDILTTPEDVAAGLRDYATLESAGWKAAGGTAIRLDDDQGRFYAAMLDAYARRGAARVYRYRFNDRPVAVDLCIESESVQVVLKTTYDESIKGLSPAFLMRQDVLAREWAARRLKRIEFYGRRLAWHQRWTDDVRVLYHLNEHRWPWLNRWGGSESPTEPGASEGADVSHLSQTP